MSGRAPALSLLLGTAGFSTIPSPATYTGTSPNQVSRPAQRKIARRHQQNRKTGGATKCGRIVFSRFWRYFSTASLRKIESFDALIILLLADLSTGGDACKPYRPCTEPLVVVVFSAGPAWRRARFAASHHA